VKIFVRNMIGRPERDTAVHVVFAVHQQSDPMPLGNDDAGRPDLHVGGIYLAWRELLDHVVRMIGPRRS